MAYIVKIIDMKTNFPFPKLFPNWMTEHNLMVVRFSIEAIDVQNISMHAIVCTLSSKMNFLSYSAFMRLLFNILCCVRKIFIMISTDP